MRQPVKTSATVYTESLPPQSTIIMETGSSGCATDGFFPRNMFSFSKLNNNCNRLLPIALCMPLFQQYYCYCQGL